VRSGEREALAERVLGFAQEDLTEAIVFDEASALTRFTQNAIHQNVAQADTVVRIRTVVDGRTGVVATNDLAEDALRAAVQRSKEMALLAPPDESFAGLAANAQISAPGGAYAPETATASPELRADIAADLIGAAERNGLWAAGYVTTARSGVTIANSAGALVSFDGTYCGLNVKANGADSSGYAEVYANDVAQLDGARAGAVAAEKARKSAQPIALEPGLWTVILEPAAFGELLAYLSDHFSAQAVDEGSSFLSDGLDRTYAGTNVTIGDDFAHPLHAGMPFDYEGYPTRALPLLAAGVARNVVTDATWAKRLGRENTGHGLPAPSAEGPQARYLVLSGGEKPVDRLIAETKRGLLVTRFWYIRPVDQRKTIVTGMTRDGTFLIENGAVVGGVNNLRFNQSILETLCNAEFGDRQFRTGGYNYSIVVPAAKIEDFHFSSTTAF